MFDKIMLFQSYLKDKIVKTLENFRLKGFRSVADVELNLVRNTSTFGIKRLKDAITFN